MTRLPYLRRDELDEDALRIWDGLSRFSDLDIVTPEGGLAGPFNAFVHAPAIGSRMSALGSTLRTGMSLDRRLLELAIITVGARWKAEFEWWAHARMALEAGVPDAVVDAIARGEEPALEGEDDRAVHAVARQLAETGSIDDATYARARAALGDRGMVEIVSLSGYYTLISFILNAFDVPLPADATPQWGD